MSTSGLPEPEPRRPPAGVVDVLIDELVGDDAPPAQRFTLERSKAREALRAHLLEDPYRYVLFLIRAAVRQGATRVDVVLRRRLLELTFDGRGFSRGELERLYDAPVDRALDRHCPGLRELALGLGALSGCQLGVRLESVPAEGEAAVLALTAGGAERLGGEATGRGTRIRVEGRPDGSPWVLDEAGRRPEEQHLRRACRFSPVPIRLDGRDLARSLVDCPDALEAAPLAAEGITGEVGYLPLERERGVLYLLRDGVVLAEETLPKAAGGFVAVVQAPGVRLDVTESKLIRDAAYQGVVAAAMAAHASQWRSSVSRRCELLIAERAVEGLRSFTAAFRLRRLLSLGGVALVAQLLSTLVLLFWVEGDSFLERLASAAVVAAILATVGVTIVLWRLYYRRGVIQPARRRFDDLYPPGAPLRERMETLEVHHSLREVVSPPER